VLIIVFSVTLNGRKREFSVFRVLGATKRKLVSLILSESCLVSIFGTIAGMAAAAFVVFPFSTYISSLLGLPYLQPSHGTLSGVAVMSFMISFTIGPLASVYAAIKIGSSEIYTVMKEGE